MTMTAHCLISPISAASGTRKGRSLQGDRQTQALTVCRERPAGPKVSQQIQPQRAMINLLSKYLYLQIEDYIKLRYQYGNQS